MLLLARDFHIGALAHVPHIKVMPRTCRCLFIFQFSPSELCNSQNSCLGVAQVQRDIWKSNPVKCERPFNSRLGTVLDSTLRIPPGSTLCCLPYRSACTVATRATSTPARGRVCGRPRRRCWPPAGGRATVMRARRAPLRTRTAVPQWLLQRGMRGRAGQRACRSHVLERCAELQPLQYSYDLMTGILYVLTCKTAYLY